VDRVTIEGAGEIEAHINAFRWQHHESHTDAEARDRLIVANAAE